ncbi:MAG: Do family serine endopeptidase [bacterium]|nr:Do family serine endopeptidase [bacterium]
MKHIKFLLLAIGFIVILYAFDLFKKNEKHEEKKDVLVSKEVINLQESFVAVAEAAKPAVVSVTTEEVEEYEIPGFEFFFDIPDEFKEFFGLPREPQRRKYKRRYSGTGSGVIVSKDGYILTNEHVIRNAQRITVSLNDGRKFSGKVVGQDSRLDLAVIKIKGDNLPYLTLGDSDKVRVGDWAIAIGSPFGLEQTVTVGIVSAIRQSVSIEGRTFRNLIQTDAAINRGNSGGPLLNIKAEVIGINTAIFAPTGVFAGVGFAIPSNQAKAVIKELIEKGKVTRGWLGIEIKEVDEVIKKQFALPEIRGALVNNVLDGPAKDAGIKRADVIWRFNGIDVKNVAHLQDLVAATKPGTIAKVEVYRDKKLLAINVKVGEMPERIEAKVETKKWGGMSVSDINDELRSRYQIPLGEKGVVVIELDEDGEAARAGIAIGDLIKAINQKPTPDVSEFEKVVAKASFGEGVVFDILRKGRPIYLSYLSR